MKPVASGSKRAPAGLRNADAMALAEASNVSMPYEAINPYCFLPPISPHIAAEDSGSLIDIGVIATGHAILAAASDYVVVEGAGGWLAPISVGGDRLVRAIYMGDIALALNLPVLLVVGLRLGCLNHALLTKRAIEADGAPFAGWIGNEVCEGFDRHTENLQTLAHVLGQEALAVVPFGADGAATLRLVKHAAVQLAQSSEGG
jgi:dethiobiotin synthetase